MAFAKAFLEPFDCTEAFVIVRGKLPFLVVVHKLLYKNIKLFGPEVLCLHFSIDGGFFVGFNAVHLELASVSDVLEQEYFRCSHSRSVPLPIYSDLLVFGLYLLELKHKISFFSLAGRGGILRDITWLTRNKTKGLLLNVAFVHVYI